MNRLTKWNLNDGLLPAALGGIDELLHSVFERLPELGPEWMSDRVGGRLLSVDIGEKELAVMLPLPGCDDESIAVEMLGDVLTIRAERREDKTMESGKRYLRRERTAMNYEESVKLPVRVKADQATARYEDGVLTVTLPREESVGDRTHVVKVD